MADQGGKRLLAEFEAAFEAALERAENVAADDLALSLLQDRDLPSALSSRAAYALVGSARQRVVAIGSDYVAAGPDASLVMPLDRALFASAPGRAPVRRDESLKMLLRRWARGAMRVEIAHSEGEISGIIRAAGRDHIVLAAHDEEVILPMARVRWIRFDPWGSTDAP